MNNMCEENTKRSFSKMYTPFRLFIALAIAIGVALRLYMILDQILLGDEWHGVDYVIGNSFSYLLTHCGFGATCIPMNLYNWFLLKTFGWSEFLLVLPSISAGILSLVIFPIFVRKIFSSYVTVVFSFLLALSPYLIFYSRVCRPYIMVMFFGFICVVSLYLWATGQGRRYAVVYVIAGVAAVYFHLFAIIAVLAPLGYIFVAKLIAKLRDSTENRCAQIIPGLWAFVLSGIAIVLLLCLLLLPALLHSSIGTVLKEDRLALRTVIDFACFLSGTPNKLVVAVFCGLLLFGLVRLLRDKSLLGGIFITVIVMYFLALVISSSQYISLPHVISRYLIVVFPMSFLLVALGLDGFSKYLQSTKLITGSGYGFILGDIAAAVLLVTVFVVGPLLRIYAVPSNYINNSAFFDLNQPLPWEPSYSNDLAHSGNIAHGFVTKEGLPGFYKWLANEPNAGTIIEYPMVFGDGQNFYYQHFHKKKIIAGYSTALQIENSESPGFIHGMMYADHVFSKVSDKSRLKFRNMIDVMDIETVKKSGAAYIVLHKNLSLEMSPERHFLFKISSHLAGKACEAYPLIGNLDKTYRNFFGSPFFEDYYIIVFKIFQD